MKKVYFSFMLLFSAFSCLYSQSYRAEWIEKSGIATMAKDNNGNLYVLGNFYGNVNVFGNQLTSYGSNDFYLAKLDTNDNLIWINHFGGSGIDNGTSIACDNSSNVIITGYFSDTCHFGDTALICKDLTTDIFILKISSSGNRIWIKQLNATEGNGISLTNDLENNIYISGIYKDTLSFGDTTIISMEYLGGYIYSGILVKYDSSGVFKWVRSLPISIGMMTIRFDSNNYIYVTGAHDAYCDFEYATVSNLFYLAKFDVNGILIWDKYGHCASFSQNQNFNCGNSIAFDNNHNIYVSISNVQNLLIDTISNIPTGSYVLKINPNGNIIWINNVSNTNQNIFENYITNFNNRLFLLHHINNNLNSGFSSLNISELDTNCTVLWTKIIVAKSSITSNKILCKNNDEIFFSGSFHDSLYIDTIAMYSQAEFAFLAKLRFDSLLINVQSDFEHGIVIYPNPFNQIISVDFKDQIVTNKSVIILNTEGKLISVPQSINGNRISFNFSNYSRGVYFLKIISDKFCMVKTLIKR